MRPAPCLIRELRRCISHDRLLFSRVEGEKAPYRQLLLRPARGIDFNGSHPEGELITQAVSNGVLDIWVLVFPRLVVLRSSQPCQEEREPGSSQPNVPENAQPESSYTLAPPSDLSMNKPTIGFDARADSRLFVSSLVLSSPVQEGEGRRLSGAQALPAESPRLKSRASGCPW